MSRLGIGLAAAIVVVLTGGARATDRAASDSVIAGEHVAQRNCAGCHAVGGDGPSPLSDAPPFRDIHTRYRVGGLGRLLQEGMLAPTTPPEEGSPTRHPRMPMASLGADEIAELTAYLKSLEPAHPTHEGPRR